MQRRKSPFQNLRIEEENFDSQFQSQQQIQQLTSEQSQCIEINEEMLVIKISSLIHQLVSVKEKLFLYEDLCCKLRKQNQQLTNKLTEMQKSQSQNKKIHEQKLANISQQQKLIKEKTDIIQELQKQVKNYEQSNKQNLALQSQAQKKLLKKQKQLLKVNHLLEKELETSNTKIIQLERIIHDRNSTIYFGQMNRLKQSNRSSITNVLNLSSSKVNFKTEGNSKNIGESVFWKARAISTKNYNRFQ